MTTYVSAGWSGACVVNSNADFQAYVQKTEAALLGCGMVAVPQTGEIDPLTVARPSSGLDAGFRCYRFADTVQATYPLFLKITYGVASSNLVRIKITVAAGLNGSGTTTGQASTLIATGGGQPNTGTVGTLTNYACHTEGYLFVAIALNNPGQTVPVYSFSVSRSRDSGGAFDGLGAVVWTGGTSTGVSSTMAFVRIKDNVFSGSNSTHYCIAPGNPANTALIGGDKQLYPHFYADPSVQQLWSQFTVRGSEFLTTPTTFTATCKYSEARTYMILGSAAAHIAESADTSAFRLASLWE